MKYPDHLPETLFKALKQGATVKSFCAKHGIERTKFYQWCKAHPELKKALITGREAARELWLIRCKLPDFNPETGKRFPNTSFHRLLATNIYGRDFLPENHKLTDDEFRFLRVKRILASL